ncbi:MAG: hypothetical protein HG422_06940 [Prevotella sp.]|nr:hypothetical protein [Prevotella sp.]
MKPEASTFNNPTSSRKAGDVGMETDATAADSGRVARQPKKVLTMINASASVGSRHETPCNKTGCGHSLVDGVVLHNIGMDKLCRSLCRAGRNGRNKRSERREKFCHTPYYIIGRADKVAKEGREQL